MNKDKIKYFIKKILFIILIVFIMIKTPYAFSKTYTVIVNKLNVREGPGRNYPVIGALEKGDNVYITKIVEEWAQLQTLEAFLMTGKIEAWVHKKYLELPASKNEALHEKSDQGKRFIDNKDETISDTKTGLMWAKKDSGVGIDFSQWVDLGKGLDWNEAKKYISQLKIGGYTDWRMPSINELRTINDGKYDISNLGKWYISPAYSIFASGGAPSIWSSDVYRNDTEAYAMNFYTGTIIRQAKSRKDLEGVRAVRLIPMPSTVRNYPLPEYEGLINPATPIQSMVDFPPLKCLMQFTGTQFIIQNKDTFDWTNAIFKISLRTDFAGYVLTKALIKAGKTGTIDAMLLWDGKESDMFAYIDLCVFSIVANTPEGRGQSIWEWKDKGFSQIEYKQDNIEIHSYHKHNPYQML